MSDNRRWKQLSDLESALNDALTTDDLLEAVGRDAIMDWLGIPADRRNTYHTVTVTDWVSEFEYDWHMAHPITCVLGECRYDRWARSHPFASEGVYVWRDLEDGPVPAVATEREYRQRSGAGRPNRGRP